MNVIALIFKEVLHRKFNFLATLIGVAAAVAMFVAFYTTGEAAKRDTRRAMIVELGFNLRLVHRDNDMAELLSSNVPQVTLQEADYHRLSQAEGLSYNHILAVLQRKIKIDGKPALLYGMASRSVSPPDKTKPPIIKSDIPEGSVVLGRRIADALNLKKRDTLDVQGRRFTISTVLREKGDVDDIKIFMNLKEAQELFNLPGQLSDIMAVECLSQECLGLNYRDDMLSMLRGEIEKLLPNVTVLRDEDLAETRRKARMKSEKYFVLAVSIVTVACACWIGILAAINARDRRREIGILRALGHGSGRIAGLFLGKALLAGLLGALIGYALGSAVALHYGPQIFQLTKNNIEAMPQLLMWSLLAAPLFAAVSSFIPAMLAVAQDPAITLSDN